MTAAVLGEGLAEFGRLQSVFGLVRALGGGYWLAAGIQGVIALTVAGGLWWLWSRRAPYDLKAAALAAAALIVTPYLYMYDLCVLAVAVAFLLRHALSRGLQMVEAAALGLVALLLLIYPYVKMQVGLAAAVVVLALIAQRIAEHMFPRTP